MKDHVADYFKQWEGKEDKKLFFTYPMLFGEDREARQYKEVVLLTPAGKFALATEQNGMTIYHETHNFGSHFADIDTLCTAFDMQKHILISLN